jgi:hypothetical protein
LCNYVFIKNSFKDLSHVEIKDTSSKMPRIRRVSLEGGKSSVNNRKIERKLVSLYMTQRKAMKSVGNLSLLEVSLRRATVDDVGGVVFVVEDLQQLRPGVVEGFDDETAALHASLNGERDRDRVRDSGSSSNSP